MAAIQNQVISEYLSVIKGEKTLDQLGRKGRAKVEVRHSADAGPPSPTPTVKGRYIDLVV